MNNENKSARAVIRRIMSAYGVANDMQLSAIINVSRTTISSWRTRDVVPYSLCAQLYEENRISLEWLLFGEGQGKKPPQNDDLLFQIVAENTRLIEQNRALSLQNQKLTDALLEKLNGRD